MWKILKKILRTIALWLPLCCMVVNAYAVDEMETVPLYPYFTSYWTSENSPTSYVRAFKELRNASTAQGASPSYKGIFIYQSALDKNTFYHVKFELTALGNEAQNQLSRLETGAITQQGGEISTLLFPANAISFYANALNESYNTQSLQQINWSYENAIRQSITSYVGAKAYYYFTKKSASTFTVDIVMYFNDEFFQYGWNYNASATRYMQCYLGIVMPFSGVIGINDVTVYPVGGSDYSGKLDQIIALLQSQGGSLSKEDIQAATLAALEQHDAAEKQQGNAAINDAQNQLNGAFSPYIQNLEAIKNAFNGFTSALSYSGTGCLISFPAAINPMTNTELWGQNEINLAYYYNQIPPALRYLIKASLSALIFYSVILEVIDTIRRITGVSDND